MSDQPIITAEVTPVPVEPIVNVVPPQDGIQVYGSQAFSFNKDDFRRWLINLGIGLIGVCLTYITQQVGKEIAHIDLGAWTPVVVVLWSALIKYVDKYTTNTQVIKV